MNSRAARGYLLVAGAFLIMGLIGVLVDWATAPESALLVLRFATAGIVLGIVFARRRPLAGAFQDSVWPRLLLMALLDVCALLLFFFAIRSTSVAIGMFLQFMAPVWVALLAPRFFRVPTERIVYPALALALGGLAAILAPSLLGDGVRLAPAGVVAGVMSGIGYAGFMLVVKDLTKRVSSVTIVLSESVLYALLLLGQSISVWTVGGGALIVAAGLLVVLFGEREGPPPAGRQAACRESVRQRKGHSLSYRCALPRRAAAAAAGGTCTCRDPLHAHGMPLRAVSDTLRECVARAAPPSAPRSGGNPG